ncbi:AzlD domain-containing protein [Demequina sp. SYSU T00039]|uniref:AzlD domain-containing protein n=1 Tax=Demequina lignilytica TaxID=3051663 RepID=A0AAW7M1L6_9MICO|nr:MULTISPECIES: AzlD domain-containing protein [unclassified Demequina]MDN4477161.1 AzlD domain-containing protein [Demequina sp. SYSU T00039-1]MDN4484009.1 AzlD domain-containing protein [Demequina sp. SYSU T0a273]MDN4487334.1 AzlD domain-containing protein [Demequina sp. SYSU T00039]MDN4491087.1 AzlD domain-containing protein [Demequina sp. SYSU T00068]
MVAAGLLAWLTKLAGHAVPESWLEDPRVHRIAAFVTVALLSALVAVQTFASGRALAVDARVAALAVAALLLWRRAPFIVVVAAAAAVAAGLRALGWG